MYVFIMKYIKLCDIYLSFMEGLRGLGRILLSVTGGVEGCCGMIFAARKFCGLFNCDNF